MGDSKQISKTIYCVCGAPIVNVEGIVRILHLNRLPSKLKHYSDLPVERYGVCRCGRGFRFDKFPEEVGYKD